MSILGASEIWPGIFRDNGGASWNVTHPDYAATGVGSADDRGAFVLAEAVGFSTLIPAGTYRVASNFTFTKPVTFMPGAVLKPDAGVTITLNAPAKLPFLRVFDVSAAGSHIAFAREAGAEILPEWWGASITSTAAVNTPLIQEAILASLSVTSLAAQPTRLVAPVVLNGLYPVTTLYLPTFTHLRGRAEKREFGFYSTANAPVLVLGRSLAEAAAVEITLENIEVQGDFNVANTSQVGIKAVFTGGAGFAYPLTFRDVRVSYVGGAGIELLGDATSMLISLYWDRVTVIRARGYAVHTKIGIFNVAQYTNCYFNDCGNGFYVEDDGSLTNAIENHRFESCVFEALGRDPGATGLPMVVGSFGFKSTVKTGHYVFDNCYFENNGNNPADTTGANIWVRAPWMLLVTNTLLVSSNNQIWLAYGGQARVDGCYIDWGVSSPTALFTLDQPPVGTVYPNLHIGRNHYPTAYTDAQLVRSIGSSTTTVTGFTSVGAGYGNYRETPTRLRRAVLRDGQTKTLGDGAIGYAAVKRVLDNSGGANTIAVNGVGTIVKDTFNGAILFTSDVGVNVGLFLVTAGGGIGLVSQVSGATYLTTTKDTAAHTNVYWDSGLAAFVVQNKMGSAIKVSVRLLGIDHLLHADDGYYETQFA